MSKNKKNIKKNSDEKFHLTSGDLISGKAGTSMGGKSGSFGTLGSRSRINTKLNSLDGGFSSIGDGDFGGGEGVRGYKRSNYWL